MTQASGPDRPHWQTRRRRRRAVAVRRASLVGTGLMMLPMGLVVMPTPVPVGLVLFVGGLYFIARGSRTARHSVKRIRRWFPRLSRWLNTTAPRMPRPLRLFIQRSDPGL